MTILPNSHETSLRRRPRANPLLLVLAVLLLAAPAAFATNQVVTDPGDNGGLNQLRAKLAALQNTGGGTLTFNMGAATVVLLQGTLPAITTNSTIDGGGNITISGNNATRVLYISGGGTLRLRNITVSNGYSSGGDGGAIYNSGSLTVTACKFINNQTSASWSGGAIITYGPLNISNSEFGGNKGGGGGAVYPRWGNSVTTITGCNFHDNEAINGSGAGYGGALLLWDGPSVTISNSTFSNNKARGGGGAIFVLANSTLNVSKTTLSGNGVPFQYNGGGIYNLGNTTLTNVILEANSATGGGGIYNAGTVTLSDVTVSGNAGSFGCGIFSSNGAATLTNTTLSGNFVGYRVGTRGGGMYVDLGRTMLTNVTLSGNDAESGGGIYLSGAVAELTNVTLSGNTSGIAYIVMAWGRSH